MLEFSEVLAHGHLALGTGQNVMEAECVVGAFALLSRQGPGKRTEGLERASSFFSFNLPESSAVGRYHPHLQGLFPPSVNPSLGMSSQTHLEVNPTNLGGRNGPLRLVTLST